MATKISSIFPVSENVARMKASSTLAAMQAADALRAAGVDVVDLGAGEPDFDTPQNIKDAAAEAMRAGQTKYTPTAGTRELQDAVIQMYGRDFDASYDRRKRNPVRFGNKDFIAWVYQRHYCVEDSLLPA